MADGEINIGLPDYRITYIPGIYSTDCMSHVTPPSGNFPSSIDRQPRGCQYRTICVFGKLSATCFQRRPWWHRHYSDYCGGIDHGKSDERGVIRTVVLAIILTGSSDESEIVSVIKPENKVPIFHKSAWF